MEITGNYNLDISIGGSTIPIYPSMIEELTISQDIDRLVPTFKMKVKDATGLLGEIIPFDKNSNTVSIRISRGQNADNVNEFIFEVKRRKPTFDKIYEIEGMLKVDNLFANSLKRGFSGNIKTNLESIADELEISDTEIDTSLEYSKTILQPKCSNSTLLVDLKNNLIGKNGESDFYCFIKNIKGVKTFTFRSIDSLFSDAIKYKFIVGGNPFEDYFPVVDYSIYDNSQLITDFGAKVQKYNYFDYATGQQINDSANIDDCPALCEYFLVDNENNSDGSLISGLGRNNLFNSNFEGTINKSFYGRITNLIHMWISTWGMENLAPGDIVKVIFSEALAQGNLFIYQHSGYWMVKRIVHVITNSFMSNILLTRCGIDSDLDNSLLETTKTRKND